MSTSETVTKIFTNDDETIPLRIDVPIKVPIKDFVTENISIVNCYTTGRPVSYLLRGIEYGLENLMYVHYAKV